MATKILGKKSSFLEFRSVINAGESFRNASSSLVGFKADQVNELDMGRLAERLRRELCDAELSYVVYSYRTPIAWRLVSGEWVIPNERYSVTTSAHQNKIRAAVLS